MEVKNKFTDEVIYFITGFVGALDEALDLMAPEDWRDQVNENGWFHDPDYNEDFYYDDLELV